MAVLGKASASAPGKVILFGEHFVVYDKPAIVSAISLRAFAEAERTEKGFQLNDWNEDNPALAASRYVAEKLGYRMGMRLRLRSQIPQAVGLGSSAAVSVAAAAAASLVLLNRIDLNLVMEAAHEGEKLVHYRPSGIDTAIASLGGGGIYRRSMGFRSERFGLERILVVNTGKMRKTGELVRKVKVFRDSDPARFNAILEMAENIIQESIDALKSPDVELIGRLMAKNQNLLKSIGVSSREIDEAIKLCMKAGALGAKLTGAGGGGCVIAVAEYEKLPKIAEEVGRVYQSMVLKLMVEGVRPEHP